MPKRAFPFEPGGPNRVVVTWRFPWRRVEVAVDSVIIGRFEGKAELEAGRELTAPDGAPIGVRLRRQSLGIPGGLEVTRAGRLLPDSVGHPETEVKTAYGLLFFVAFVNVALGLAAVAFPKEVLDGTGAGWAGVIEGSLYAGLGVLVKTRRSAVALGFGLGLVVLDGVLTTVETFQAGGIPGGGWIMRFIIITGLWRGFRALRKRPTRAVVDAPLPDTSNEP